jgi:hypothetical protein
MRIKLSAELKESVLKNVQENNAGKRYLVNGSKKDQYIGMLGETALKNYFKIKYEPLEDNDDCSFHYYGRKIDVKTMALSLDPNPEFVNSLTANQKNTQADTYIFTSFNQRTSELFVLGWVSLDELLDKTKKLKKKTKNDDTTLKAKATVYKIKNRDLNPISTL